MKLWLDDLRPVPYGYEGAKSVNEAKTVSYTHLTLPTTRLV